MKSDGKKGSFRFTSSNLYTQQAGLYLLFWFLYPFVKGLDYIRSAFRPFLQLRGRPNSGPCVGGHIIVRLLLCIG